MAEADSAEGAVGLQSIWYHFKVPIILGCISLLCIVLSITILFKSYQSSIPIEFHQAQEGSQEAASTSATLTVDIEGAVKHPGVYRLPVSSRIEEAIIAAGGLSADADIQTIAQTINRAAKVVDGAKIFLPKKGNDAVEASSEAPSVSGVTTISVNSASQSQLEELSGVGPVTAQKIIDGRPYQTLEELVSKKAVSQSLFEKIKNDLSL
jgi:competence protein ComEA